MKSARFLVFSLAISCFLICLSFYIIWVIKANPPFLQETHFYLQFNPVEFKGDLTTTSIPKDTNFNFSKAGKTPDIRASDAVASESRGAADEIKMVNNSSNVASFDSKLSALALKYSIPPAGNHSISIPGINPLDLTSQDSHPQDKDKKPPDLRAEVHSGNQPQDVPEATSEKVKTLSKNKKNPIEEENSKGSCDVTKGRWVFDDSYPLYTNNTCPYIDEGFNCEANGRMDKGYMKWRWKPKDCSIPRFNATKVLELIRGKRLVFVGDSLNRNQWESMLCLLMGAIKDPKKVYETHGRRITKHKGDYSFKFVDYQCTVEYYVTHFLVHEGKARIGKKRLQTLRIDTIDKGSSRWRGADILVFNTAHWWSHQKTKAGINYYQEGGQIHPRLEVLVAFRRAATTWASWVDKYVNPQKTRVFFRSSAPSHFSGGQWNSGGHCKEAFRPTNVTTSSSPVNNGIVQEVIRLMKTPVTFLNITELSSFRKDGHPSVYGKKSERSGVQDCSHWCLPGVPDSWNELLYYYLHSNLSNSRSPKETEFT